MKLYVGNLPWKVRDNDLKKMFETYGTVEDAIVIQDKRTGRSKGFGFVTFSSEDDAKKALAEMAGKEVEGRALTVNEARPMEQRDERFPRRDSREEPKEAPMANPEEINEMVEDSIEESQTPEIVDENSDAEEDKGEEPIENVNEAMEDAESDKPAIEDATPAEESIEKEVDASEE